MNTAGSTCIQSTAGAVTVKNKKGEVSMQKVKVHRYVCGKRPNYAPLSSSEEDSEDDFTEHKVHSTFDKKSNTDNSGKDDCETDETKNDSRLRRLQILKLEKPDTSRSSDRHELEHTNLECQENSQDEMKQKTEREEEEEEEEDEEEEELSESEIERRRTSLKQKLIKRLEEPELMGNNCEEDENKSTETYDSDSSDSDEITDTENSTGTRLKPVFVSKKDRVTLLEKERAAIKQKQADIEEKKLADERRKQLLRCIESEVRSSMKTGKESDEHSLFDVDTEDENEEIEYEAWKLRELKRIKRDKEEREQLEKEQLETEILRNMTEEERRADLRNNPKKITNKGIKGKYKFLQKYYHRGSFYMDMEQELYKRDFSVATLEDQFDKTVLPKVMQVKNFGRSGRTKYTHLVDQDTTQFDSPWISETAQNLKFHTVLAAGVKQVFEKPSRRKQSH